MDKDRLFKEENILDLYRFSRFMYANGRKFLNDDSYRALELQVKEKYKDNPLLKQTYDDDDFPVDIFPKYGITLKPDLARELNAPKVINHPRLDEIKKFIQGEGTSSIEAYETYEKCYEWFMQVRDFNLIASLKIDGVNSRSVLLKCKEQPVETPVGKVAFELVCSSSRGRIGDAFDITNTLGRKFPKYVFLDDEVAERLGGDVDDGFMVFGEPYVVKSSIPVLKYKYGVDDKWVNPRSTAISILRVPIKDEDYQYLKFKVFKISGIAETLSETLTIGKELGFDITPWTTIKANTVPTDFNEFLTWLKKLLEDFAFITEDLDIESDGVVIEIDSQADFLLKGHKEQYNLGNIAIKMEKWGSDVYRSKILDYEIEGQGGKYSVVAIIEPVEVSNGVTVQRVNCFSPAIIIYNNLPIGATIEFEYKSASSVNLLYEPVPDNFPQAYVKTMQKLYEGDDNEIDNGIDSEEESH